MNFSKYSDGTTDCTAFLQQAIDQTAVGGRLVIPSGTYLTGSLFLHSDMTLELEKGAVILGIADEKAYPLIPSRVAGIEMEAWPAGLINAQGCENLTICGEGTIDGQGEYWWDKFWGKPEEQHRGGMIREYPSALRWAVDYDCFRPRNILCGNCKNLTLKDFKCERSGFWNIHVYYSENVSIDHLIIGENAGPSTDGIDIDSCQHVVIKNCQISCNDDGIVLKAGRDADGLRVNRACEDVEIANCHLSGLSQGITLGSETSGGIRKVFIHDCDFDGTVRGFRVKSARTRGGVIENIVVKNLTMQNVRCPIEFGLNWFPEYSYCKIPEDYKGEIPEYWKVLTQHVPPEVGLPLLRNVTVESVQACADSAHTKKASYEQPVLFYIDTDPVRPVENITFRNVILDGERLGKIRSVKNMRLENVQISVCEETENAAAAED